MKYVHPAFQTGTRFTRDDLRPCLMSALLRCAEAATAAAAAMADVLLPPPKDSVGKILECPVCFEEATCSPEDWRLLPCRHGVCTKCLNAIVMSHVSLRCVQLQQQLQNTNNSYNNTNSLCNCQHMGQL